MIDIILSGAGGRMGQTVAALLASRDDMRVVAGVDISADQTGSFPIYDAFDKIRESASMAVDFSHISLTPALLDFCLARRLPLLLATTGIAGELEAKVTAAAKTVPIFKCSNLSLGVSLLQTLVRQAARILGDSYEIEIVEKHHNRKLDAPSGTAFMIADAAASALPYKPEYVFDRTKEHKRRQKHEIGIAAVRGGNLVGEHDVHFIGPNDMLTLRHTAYSRELFAGGAVKAIEFLTQDRRPGLYNMDDLVAWLAGE